MTDAKVLRTIELEDMTSPRLAHYAICVKRLCEGYVVEICWGGQRDKKVREAYYRENLLAALNTFEQLVKVKTARRPLAGRHYRVSTASLQQPSLF